MAERFRLLCLAGVVGLLLAGCTAARAGEPVQYGDLEFAVEPEPKGQALHGYTEYRILVRNRGSEHTRRVTVTLPADNYPGRGRSTLQGVSRTAEVGPGLTVAMTLLQPVLPDVIGNGVKVRIDGRTMEQRLPLNLAPTRAGGGMYGYPPRYGRGRYAMPTYSPGSGGKEALVLVSQRIPETFFQRTVKAPVVPGGPGGAPVPVPAPPAPAFAPIPPPPAGAWPTMIVSTINAQTARADTPISAWSPRWLAYTRYDGIAVTREDLEELQRGTNETRAVLHALWQFTEAGGVLLVLGPGDVSVPAAWKRDPLRRTGFTVYQVGFGQCLISPDRSPEKWDAGRTVADAALASLRPWKVPPDVLAKLEPLKKQYFSSSMEIQTELEAVFAKFPALAPRLREHIENTILAHFRSDDRWSTLNSALSQAVTPWGTRRGLTDLNKTFPVVDDLGVPVKGLFALMILFSIALGPVNLVVLGRKNKRIWMLWTVPALSMLTCMAVFGYMIVAEGWQGHARVAGITILDEIDHCATSLGRTAFYSPLTPGDGLRFSEDTEVQVQAVQDGGLGSSCTLDWTQGQHLPHGWVTARVPAHFTLRKSEPHRVRLNIRREADGTLSLVNALGVDVKTLWVADEKGVLHQGGPIAAGERAVLQRSARKPVKARPAEKWRQLYSRGDWIKSALSAADRPEEILGPWTYIAVVHGSPFLEQALQGANARESPSVVLGVMADPREK